MVGDIRRGPARGPLELCHFIGMISFQWNDFIPMEWFHSNGMILFQWNDFIPMEWFYYNRMILLQWNDSALKKKPYEGLNLTILEWILDQVYSIGMFIWQNWNIKKFCIEDCNLADLFIYLNYFCLTRKWSLDGWGYKEGASMGATWVLSFYWNDLIPMEWFHANGMI